MTKPHNVSSCGDFEVRMKQFLIAFVCLLAATLCAEEKNGDVLRVATLNGPTSVPVAYLYEHAPALPGTAARFEVLATATQELPKLIKGEVHIGVLPANAAAKVYVANKGALVALGVCGTGNLFLLTTDAAFRSLADLRGKTVACAGQGATPEYVFRYVLGAAGVNAGDGADAVRLDFSLANADIAAALAAGKVRYALVPEPFATVAQLKGSGIIRALDVQEAYSAATGGATYPMTLLVANAAYTAAHPDVVDAFIAAYKTAVEWTNAHPREAGELAQKHTLGLTAAVVERSIPNAAYTWQDARAARADIERLLRVYLRTVPQAVGGALPDDGFYYSR